MKLQICKDVSRSVLEESDDAQIGAVVGGVMIGLATVCRSLRPPTYKTAAPVGRYSQSPTSDRSTNIARHASLNFAFKRRSLRPPTYKTAAPVGRYSQSPTSDRSTNIARHLRWRLAHKRRSLRVPTYQDSSVDLQVAGPKKSPDRLSLSPWVIQLGHRLCLFIRRQNPDVLLHRNGTEHGQAKGHARKNPFHSCPKWRSTSPRPLTTPNAAAQIPDHCVPAIRAPSPPSSSQSGRKSVCRWGDHQNGCARLWCWPPSV